jgi:hypothetical protein
MAVLLLFAAMLAAQVDAPPPGTFVSKDTCPFECCAYGNWTANRNVALLDRPGGKPIATVRRGETVTALTGEVHSTPVAFPMEHDDPASGIAQGTVVYLLHPMGEGTWRVWYRGKVLSIGEIYHEELAPPQVWWAKIETRSKQIGYARMSTKALSFDHVDRCGEPPRRPGGPAKKQMN